MQFGVFIPQGWRLDLVGIDTADQWSAMQRVAWQAEQLGFDSIWVYDHFHTVPVPTQEPTYEAWTLMASLATVTERVRLGQMCTCNGYRNPAYLAKVAASIDAISGGRVDMGIGGGWYEAEYLGYGYPFPKPSVRLGELDEAVQIMHSMWSNDETTFHGKHYTIDGAICQPRPAAASIPMWIAGGGEQLTLRTAAKYADYTNFGQTLDNFRHKSRVLEAHCEAVGRDFGQITRSVNFNIAIGSSQSDVDARLDWYRDHFRPFVGDERVEKMIDGNLVSSGGMAGRPDEIVETLAAWQDAGMDYAIIYLQEAAYDESSMELFAKEVMPAFA